MNSRRPRPAVSHAALPTLVSLLAGATAGCHDLRCSDHREGELQSHGAEAADDLAHGHASRALKEIGIALGVLHHPVRVLPPAPAVVDPVRPPPVPTPPSVAPYGSHMLGDVAAVGPEVARPPPARPAHYAGPQPGARMPVHPGGRTGQVR